MTQAFITLRCFKQKGVLSTVAPVPWQAADIANSVSSTVMIVFLFLMCLYSLELLLNFRKYR